mgnify:CR=1 FL=1
MDPTVQLGATYTYRVAAINASGPSTYTNTAQVAVPSLPAAPTDLTATLQFGPQIALAWTDNANNETGFMVERSINGGAFAPIATLGANATTYPDTTVLAATTYSYRVKAVNLVSHNRPTRTPSR